jgi:ketosteroid isomerase-like protein
MRRPIILSEVIVLALMFLPACAPQADPVVAESTSAETDVEAIKRVNIDLINAFNVGDVPAAVDLAMDDAVDLPPNRQAVVGKEAIREFLQSDMDRFAMHFVDEIVEVEVDGDLAVIWSNYTVRLTPRDGGGPIENQGKWLKVLKRQPDGSWKFSRNIWNSDNPPPTEPGN